MEPAKPAGPPGGHRVVIANWKPHEKGSLKGFFTATLPSGLVLHSLMLHERGGSRWIGFPAREWVDQTGTKQYVRFVAFTSRAVADKFRDMVLGALDAYLELEGSAALR
jgi:DMSO/TMAO reductase YedYZ molybdopterin-dependent catalytic subunit